MRTTIHPLSKDQDGCKGIVTTRGKKCSQALWNVFGTDQTVLISVLVPKKEKQVQSISV